MSNSTFTHNSAFCISYSGGIDNYSRGGGIDNVGGTLTVSSSTFAGNRAGYYGGGIENSGTLTVSNSTFAGNNAHDGGGIDNRRTATVSNSTFADNSASWLGGGGIYNAKTMTLRNTIVAKSAAGGNCAGTITDGGGNLSYPDATCPGIYGDPLLGPLQDNGGPTQTMALLSGSAAIDAANDAICAAPPVNNLDQRGITRPYGPHCDIGAYEAIFQRTFLPIMTLPPAWPPPTR